MEFKNEKLETSFTLPERITVRMQMAYFSEAALAFGEELFFRLWRAARTMITDWQSELVPSLGELNLDEADDPRIADLVMWAAMEVKKHMDTLDKIPKN